MQGKKAVIIGGGHGTSVVMSALSGTDLQIGGVFSMADNGGSTGKLRDELGISAVGDIRQCMVALSTKSELAKLFAYRFKSGDLAGHSLGNLFLAAGELRSGSIEESIKSAKKALGVEAGIMPSTTDKCDLWLDNGGQTAKGVYEIANTDFGQQKPILSLKPVARLSKSAAKAIAEADFIIIAPGNFYCSVLPALLVAGMVEAINDSSGKVIQVANLVNRAGHTAGFKATDYPAEISRLAGQLRVDVLIYNTGEIPADCLRPGEQPLSTDLAPASYRTVGAELADTVKIERAETDKIAAVRSLVRHDKSKLKNTLLSQMKEL